MAEPDSHRACADRLLPVADHLLTVNTGVGLPDQDARSVALTNTRAVILSAVMTLNVLSHGAEGRMDEQTCRALFGVDKGPLQEAASLWEQTSRLSLVLLFQFQVENLLRNLATALGVSITGSIGFYNVAKTCLAASGVPDADRKLEILNVLALIRNSLHGNGIHHGHKGSSTVTMLDTVKYEFTHGVKVSCAGWGHVAHALAHVARVVEELVTTPNVAGIPHVHDEYAAHMASLQTAP